MSPEMLTAIAAVVGAIGGFSLNLIFSLVRRPQEREQNDASIAQTVRVVYDEMIDDIKGRYDQHIEDLVARVTEQDVKLAKQEKEIACLYAGQEARDKRIYDLEMSLAQTRRELDAANVKIRQLESEREQLKNELEKYRAKRGGNG